MSSVVLLYSSPFIGDGQHMVNGASPSGLSLPLVLFAALRYLIDVIKIFPRCMPCLGPVTAHGVASFASGPRSRMAQCPGRYRLEALKPREFIRPGGLCIQGNTAAGCCLAAESSRTDFSNAGAPRVQKSTGGCVGRDGVPPSPSSSSFEAQACSPCPPTARTLNIHLA